MRDMLLSLEESRIREVANAGMGREGVLAFWFGESDEVTPEPIREAAIASLQRGETFYSHNLGLPELREALSRYTQALHPSAGVAANRIAVTSGGVNALMLACQALVNPGDEVVVVTPVWPNLVAQPLIMGAHVRRVALRPGPDARWRLDMAALLDAVTPSTRLLVLNAPNNPTGWTLSADEQRTILAHCRRTGTWVLADEVYERLYFGEAKPNAGAVESVIPPPCAPSFLDVAEPDDALVVAHSFSKSFLMTGWRLGWLVMPSRMQADMGKLIEFNTSCAPVFVQRAALQALAIHPEITPRVWADLLDRRQVLCDGLMALPSVEVALPPGGMYAFFRPEGHPDSLLTAKRLVAEVGLGLAPGSAFGGEAEGWLRWCFASRDPGRLREGVERLRHWLTL